MVGATMGFLVTWGIRAIASVIISRRGLIVQTAGLEHVPKRGPVLFIARHFHHLYDGLALLESVPRPLHITVSLDWVDRRRLRFIMECATRAARWPVFLRPDALLPGSDGIVAQKQSVYSAGEIGPYRRKALKDCVALLGEGRALVVFPEGYPNIDPRYTPKTNPEEFLPFRPGFVAIVSAAENRLKEKVPIIPTGISYIPGPHWTARLRFGAPLYLVSFPSRKLFVSAMENRVKELSGPGAALSMN